MKVLTKQRGGNISVIGEYAYKKNPDEFVLKVYINELVALAFVVNPPHCRPSFDPVHLTACIKNV